MINKRFAAATTVALALSIGGCASDASSFNATVSAKVENDMKGMVPCGAEVKKASVEQKIPEEKGWIASVFMPFSSPQMVAGASTDTAEVKVTYAEPGKCPVPYTATPTLASLTVGGGPR